MTVESLISAAYDSYLPAFADMIPPLIKSWDEAPASDPNKAKTADAVAALRPWDFRWSADSIPTTSTSSMASPPRTAWPS